MENNQYNPNNENQQTNTTYQNSTVNEIDYIPNNDAPVTTVKNKKKKKLIILTVTLSTIIVLLSALLVLFIVTHTVKSISFSADIYETKTGSDVLLDYIILPESVKDAEVTFSSSDEEIATVDNLGRVTTHKTGTAIITATTKNKKMAACTIKVKTPNFIDLYSDIKNESWCIISEDGNSMMLDTNPNNLDKKYLVLYYDVYQEASKMIQNVNKELGFSDSVYQKMNHTTALQGRQTEENELYSVSWTYHPNNGLEVFYEVID